MILRHEIINLRFSGQCCLDKIQFLQKHASMAFMQFEAGPNSMALDCHTDQIDRNMCCLWVLDVCQDVLYLVFGQHNQQQTVIHCIGVKNLCEAGCNHGLYAELAKSPYSMLPA